MIDPQYDLVAIGRPYMDIIVTLPDDRLLREFGFPKGKSREILPEAMRALRAELSQVQVFPGGSPSNTCAVVQALGGRAAFIGKVCNDAGGRQFREAFSRSGVHFPTADYADHLGNDAAEITGTCIAIELPNENSTMVYCAGVGDRLTAVDMDASTIGAGKILYLQAHFLFSPASREAVHHGISIARRAGRQVAFSLHDHRMTDENATEFLQVHTRDGDILIGNREEFDQVWHSPALLRTKANKQMLIVTDGAKGAYIMGRGEDLHILPHALQRKENTIGAGDAWFGAFALAYNEGAPLQLCGDFAAHVASEIVGLPGGRPTTSWKRLAHQYLADVRGHRQASDTATTTPACPESGQVMRVFLDDERPTPQGWTHVSWPDEAIALLETGAVQEISLDHDLGDDVRGTGYDVILWIENAVVSNGFKPPRIIVHSANASARIKMEAGIAAISRLARSTTD